MVKKIHCNGNLSCSPVVLRNRYHAVHSTDILAGLQNGSTAAALMRAITNLNTILDWLTSLTGKVRERETHQTGCAVRSGCRRVSLQACMCGSVEIKSCFYISKFCYPQQASLYSENLQTMTEMEKQLLSQNSELWRCLILGKKNITPPWASIMFTSSTVPSTIH